MTSDSVRTVPSRCPILTVGVWIGSLLAGHPAFGAPPKPEYKENVSSYQKVIKGDAITADDTHTINRGQSWRVETKITEDSGFLSDYLWIETEARHIRAPHQEPPNPVWIVLDGEAFDADDGEEGFIVQGPTHRKVPHVTHLDKFVSVLTYFIDADFGRYQVDGYTWTTLGRHTTDPDACIGFGGGTLPTDVVPPVADVAFGSAAMLHETGTQLCDVAIAVRGIGLHQVPQAALHLGSPGQNGPAILQLGTLNDWVALDNNGAGLMLADVAFPQQAAAALLGGNVYLLVTTTAFPNGHLRAQMHPETPSAQGDLNCDGSVSLEDVSPFVEALLADGPFHGCDAFLADMNNDTQIDGGDVGGFVNALGLQ